MIQLASRRAFEAEGVADVGGAVLEPVAELYARGVGDAHHALEVRGDAGRVDHRLGAEGLDHGLAGARAHGPVASDDGLGERDELGALRHATVEVVVCERRDVGALAGQLAARPEQPGMGTGSIETVVDH